MKRKIIGIIVENEPGAMEKVSGLFARRSFNIDTINVGKTFDPKLAHIIISLDAEKNNIEQVEKQVNKLIDVVEVVDLTNESVIREHCLIKIGFKKNEEEIVSLVKKNKGTITNINHKNIVVEKVSTPEEINSFIKTIKDLEIKEISRSGINALKK